MNHNCIPLAFGVNTGEGRRHDSFSSCETFWPGIRTGFFFACIWAVHAYDCSLHLKTVLQIFHSHSTLSLSHPLLEPFIICHESDDLGSAPSHASDTRPSPNLTGPPSSPLFKKIINKCLCFIDYTGNLQRLKLACVILNILTWYKHRCA